MDSTVRIPATTRPITMATINTRLGTTHCLAITVANHFMLTHRLSKMAYLTQREIYRTSSTWDLSKTQRKRACRQAMAWCQASFSKFWRDEKATSRCLSRWPPLPAFTSDFYVGYFEPPSRAKRWIIDGRDLQSLYANCDPGSKINLWCEPNLPRENSNSGNSSEPAAKKKGATHECDAGH